jgi:hypothetical protein
MNESFLWYLWKYRLYHHDLFTKTGESLTVEHPGQQNYDSGPDFFNARVRIGETLWAGNVEVHTLSSDWRKHKHHLDKAFDSVILHVVFNNDEEIIRKDGTAFPVLELKNFIDESLWEKYRKLMKSSFSISCKKQIGNVDPLIISQWLDRTLATRLERKTIAINNLLSFTNNDWEEAFYRKLATNFGFKVNALPFEMLAGSLPYKILLRHSDTFQTEALLFGQAGLLENNFTDIYPNKLKEEYIYISKKMDLKKVDGILWKFSRMRPVNFPTIRIAQFARLISQPKLFSSIIEMKHPDQIIQLFKTSPHEYWNDHYVFDKQSAYIEKTLGEQAIQNIIINTIVPFLFAYGRHKNEEVLCARALQLLEYCKGEENKIVKEFTTARINIGSAADSQAVIELYNEYCIKKNCLNCNIGLKLLQKTE